MNPIIDVKDVSMHFRMENERTNTLKEFFVGLCLNLNQVGRVNDLLDRTETDSLLFGHGVVGDGVVHLTRCRSVP